MQLDERRADIERLRAAGFGSRRIAERLDIPRTTLRDALRRWGLTGQHGEPAPSSRGAESSGITVTGDTAAVVMPPGMSLGDLDELLRARGLDPDDWHVERVTVNEWEALADGGKGEREPRVVTLHQLKAHLRHRAGSVHPAPDPVELRWIPEPGPSTDPPAPRLIVVCGDHQAPYHDSELHEVFLRWLAEVQPDEGVLTGDTADLPTISRHRDRLRWNAGVQECVNTSFRILSDYRDAHPSTRWSKLRGNHDWRLESELMDRAERMAFIRPADRPGTDPEPHLYSVRRLLHLDRLGIELAGVEGEDWRYGEVALAPGLVVRHEPPSAAKAARLNRSVMAGHTHRQSIKQMTTFDERDEPVVRSIVEVGCMARTREGLGYVEHPDWQPGFATVAVYPDGSAHFDLATWRGGVLTWRGTRWAGSHLSRRAA